MADDASRDRERLTAIEARLRALEEADDNASWGRAAAARGGFRQEWADLLEEAGRLRARLGDGPAGA